ncbi:MAG: site-specific integrase [Holophagales bacterium]|jgi:integrase|nr:site-specific integrase [Holophagales bacterium]
MARKVNNGLWRSEGSQTYHYEIFLNGKKHKGNTGCTSKADAVQFLADKRAALARERDGLGPAPVAPTLASILEAWAAAARGSVTDKHIHDCLYMLRRHCEPVLSLPLNKIDTAAVDSLRTAYLTGTWRGAGWKADTADKTRAAGGWNKVWRHLQAVVNWAVERGLAREKPFKGRPVKSQERLRVALWPEDVGAFLPMVDGCTVEQDLRTAVRLMVLLGLRESEALGARWDWFDWRRGIYQVGKTKNRRARSIAIPDVLSEYLRQNYGQVESGLVLSGRAGGQHVAGYTKKIISLAGQKMGIDGLHPHGLRAAFATAHWEHGTPLSQITAMLGHASPQTTMGYIRQRDKDTKEAQNRVALSMRL